jgi:hypothetical protein
VFPGLTISIHVVRNRFEIDVVVEVVVDVVVVDEQVAMALVFIRIVGVTGANVTQLFKAIINVRNKLVCLFLAGLSSLV